MSEARERTVGDLLDILEEAETLICELLACPEIADCAPEDLDNETREIERRARDFIRTARINRRVG